MRLITIPISHYCERARWALDHAGLSFVEEQHLQMFHWRYVKAAGGTKTVPVLVLEDGGVLRDSSEIVRYASDATASGQGLYSGEPALDREILRLERGFCEPFGVEARRVMYYHFFRWGRPALRFNAGRAPRWERRALELGFPLASRFMHRYLDISADTERAGRAVVDRVFDEVGERLAGGKRFLVGERFTAADLTFACMAAALTCPRNYGVPLPTPDELPEPVRALVASYRAHPAGAFALRMFDEHRSRSTGHPQRC